MSLPRSGRKRKPSPAGEKKLVRMIKSLPRTTKKQICDDLEAAGTQVSVSTVKCVLHHYELRGCRARRKPSLQKRHLKFAADHMDKEKTLWRKVLWSDQTKNEHNDQKYVLRGEGESCNPNTIPTAKHGGGRILLCQWNWCFTESKRNNEGGGLPPNSSRKPKIMSQNVGLWTQLGVPTGQRP